MKSDNNKNSFFNGKATYLLTGMAILSVLLSLNIKNSKNDKLNESPLGDAANWNGFVLGDVTDCIDFEGSIAVAGDLNSDRGLSVNTGAYGTQNNQTDDYCFISWRKFKFEL